jgi:excisionase family DNA binding protein
MLTIDDEAYLSAEEVCSRLHVKPATLYTYVSRGLLRSYRQGIRRQRLYRLEEVEALLQVRPSEPPEAVKPQQPRLPPMADEWISDH